MQMVGLLVMIITVELGIYYLFYSHAVLMFVLLMGRRSVMDGLLAAL